MAEADPAGRGAGQHGGRLCGSWEREAMKCCTSRHKLSSKRRSLSQPQDTINHPVARNTKTQLTASATPKAHFRVVEVDFRKPCISSMPCRPNFNDWHDKNNANTEQAFNQNCWPQNKDATNAPPTASKPIEPRKQHYLGAGVYAPSKAQRRANRHARPKCHKRNYSRH